jgi:signal transduction histidine kinase
MNNSLLQSLRQSISGAPRALGTAFDRTATWVSQLSWWKFFLFSILILIAGALMEETLFQQDPKLVIVKKSADGHQSRTVSDGDKEIRIDGSGIHIKKSGPRKRDSEGIAGDTAGNAENSDRAVTPPTPPSISVGPDDVHIALPPEVGQEVRQAIGEAVNDAAEEKVASYRRKSSAWFMNFILLLLVGLFGTKALLGGKKRAEAQARAANAAAEREALQRQVTEAKMQMMQAQVEPHFLFNTLASVEHLIETDAPRAAAMQRRLIQYLRAVLPQMRESPAMTNLGREADMVAAYLDLMKMRMEDRLQVDVHVPEGLRSAAFPPMMLQPLVENAIKHGLESKPDGGSLRILADVANGKLRVSVADNGLGFGAVPSNGTGLGLRSVRERLALLHGERAQLIIAPNSPSGVCATIEVPYRVAN